MNKPIATIHHKAGKRSTVYADDYNKLSEYCELLEKEVLSNKFSNHSNTIQESAVFNVNNKKVEVFSLADLFQGNLNHE